MARALRIGIDFDNTIAGYDHVFADAARSAGWIETAGPITKKAIRDKVRELPDGEIKWQMLQAEVYGRRMAEAEPLEGVRDFLSRCTAERLDVFVVSHKTQFAAYDPSRVDLRQAARRWLLAQGIETPVYFEPTRGDKIARIDSLACTHFIDDLLEVFAEPAFPEGVIRIVLAAEGPVDVPDVHLARSWHDVAATIFA